MLTSNEIRVNAPSYHVFLSKAKTHLSEIKGYIDKLVEIKESKESESPHFYTEVNNQIEDLKVLTEYYQTIVQTIYDITQDVYDAYSEINKAQPTSNSNYPPYSQSGGYTQSSDASSGNSTESSAYPPNSQQGANSNNKKKGVK